ncbi:hypothetical protein IQ235_09730 [Oscillatoriales cyanobacterium LEGE 11467]|uniref:Uncharacterized protein n=1 Tax=Zarconia navalis LEGE 11467 TaxID=1828826 RepID=A0A928VXF2_9CYAN|nr:hypothetical protein [Zarconia navalis LEGE 11467]
MKDFCIDRRDIVPSVRAIAIASESIAIGIRVPFIHTRQHGFVDRSHWESKYPDVFTPLLAKKRDARDLTRSRTPIH